LILAYPANAALTQIILFNKPYGIICQFSESGLKPTLKRYIPLPDFYACGRLDVDSEGLLLLTNDGQLQARVANPRYQFPKTYWAQVEGVPDRAALDALGRGLDLGDFVSRPAKARLMAEPLQLWPRDPPIRWRKATPTSWLEVTLTEGKNRQVRRMTAKIGYPTLRLVRWCVGPWSVAGLAPGEWRLQSSDPVL